MSTHIGRKRAMWLILAAMGGLLVGELSLAQETPQVTIEATRPVTKVVGRSSSTGAPIEETTITRKVSYADLDLASVAGANELQKRVNDTAKELCKQLDDMYPLTAPTSTDCARKSSSQAMEQVHMAIAAASSKGTNR